MKVIRVIRVLRRILTDSDIIDLYGLYCEIHNNMERQILDNILRNLLVAGNIVTVPFEQMREIRKELDRFVKPVQIEIVKSDFETVSFRELR